MLDVEAKLCVPIDRVSLRQLLRITSLLRREERSRRLRLTLLTRVRRVYLLDICSTAPPLASDFRLPFSLSLSLSLSFSFTLYPVFLMLSVPARIMQRRFEVYALIAVFTYNPKGLPLHGSLLNSEANTLS